MRVFVSSTWEDLQSEREAVERVLHRMPDTQFGGMEYVGSRPQSAHDASLAEVDRSDIYIGIIGHRYGSGITELEYHRARERGLPCLIFIAGDHDDGILDAQSTARLLKFKQELKQNHVVSSFSSPAELAELVATSLHNLLSASFAGVPLSGEPPRLWNVPHPRNPNFAGREAVLTRINAAFAANTSQTVPQAIIGLAGVGKTQLAVEYVHRHAEEYEVVWWVHSEEPVALASEYGSLARALELPESSQADQGVLVNAVQAWLRQREKWMLVFDNALDPAELHPYLPQEGRGHVIITSRNPAWRSVAHPIGLEVLGREDSINFLMQRTGQQDETAARAIADVVGDLPLALEQAGAYIDARQRTLSEYLQLLREHLDAVLSRGSGSTGHPDTVVATWELNFERVASTSRAASDLLCLCAFLAPDGIDRTLLTTHAKHLPRALANVMRSPLAFDDAVEVVLRYSLMQANGGRLSMHRLVQAVVRDRLARAKPSLRKPWPLSPRRAERETQRTWAQSALEVVGAAFPEVKLQNWPTCAALLPHALATCAHAEALGMGTASMSRLLNRVGIYLKDRGQYPEARGTLERALVASEKAFGPMHAQTASCLSDLGSVVRAQGDLVGARPYLERAVAIRERVLGRDHRDTAASLNSLGNLLRAQGDFVAGRSYLERAVAINDRVLPPGDPRAALALNNLGSLLTVQGNFVSARKCLERALAISEEALGPDHLYTAASLFELGVLFGAEGQLADARCYLERALEIREKTLGADHNEIASTLNALGSVLNDQGELVAARECFERALAICERTVGPQHPHAATSLTGLGSVLQAQGDLSAARRSLEQGLQIRERALGPDHPHTAVSLSKLGNLLCAEGDLDGARAYLERALAIREKRLGHDHPDTGRSRNDLRILRVPS